MGINFYRFYISSRGNYFCSEIRVLDARIARRITFVDLVFYNARFI